MTKAPRGLGLGTTLIVVSVVATLGLMLAGLCVSHLNLMARDVNRSFAGDMARRALAQAIAEVFQDKQFGTPGHANTLSVPCTDAPDGSQGLLTFDSAQAGVWGIPASTNNLTGKGSTAGSNGRVVPLQAVHLLAVGRCRGVVRTVEVILRVPPFPWAIASDGPISSAGELQVGASTVSPVDPSVTVQQLDQAGVLSNAPGSAISLGMNSYVQGNLKCVGTANTGGSVVTGSTLQNQDAEEIPAINVTAMDPSLGGQPVTTLSQAAYPGNNPLTGRLKRSGDVSFDNVTLQGTLLYVDGTLTVNSTMNGTGMVAASGDIIIKGQALMTAADQVGMVCGGTVNLLGQGVAQSGVRGIVYAQGGVHISKLRLEGCIITHQLAGGPLPGVTLDQSLVIGVPDISRYSFPVGMVGTGTAYGGTTCGALAGFYASSDSVMVHIQRLPDGSFVVDGGQTEGVGNLTFSLASAFPDLAALTSNLGPHSSEPARPPR